MKNNSSNFEIGKQVICIEDHPEGTFKQGDIFILNGIRKGCKCHPLLLDIGMSDGIGTKCTLCGKEFGEEIQWFKSVRFAPYMAPKSKYTPEQLFKEIEKNTSVHA